MPANANKGREMKELCFSFLWPVQLVLAASFLIRSVLYRTFPVPFLLTAPSELEQQGYELVYAMLFLQEFLLF